MFWANLLRLFLTVSERIASYMADKQLLDAGEAKAIAKNLARQNERIQIAIEAGRNVVVDADADGVPDSDKYKRD